MAWKNTTEVNKQVSNQQPLPLTQSPTVDALEFNPLPTKLFYFNFHPVEVVSRYREPQLQLGENY